MNKSHWVATLALALALPAAAQNTGVVAGKAPGAVGVAHTTNLTATIVAVDAASRAVTLRGPRGNEATVIAGPEVVNFTRLKAGDKVDVQYVEAFVIELKKGGGMPVARTEHSGLERASSGAPPGGIAGRRVTIVGEVIDVDAAAQTVTVRGPKRTVDLPIRDPDQFARIAKGDQLQATYTEAVAASITPQ